MHSCRPHFPSPSLLGARHCSRHQSPRREVRGRALRIRAPIPVNGRTETTRGVPQDTAGAQEAPATAAVREGRALGLEETQRRRTRRRPQALQGPARQQVAAAAGPRVSPRSQPRLPFPRSVSQHALCILSSHLLVCPFTSSPATPCSRETSPESSRWQNRPEVRPAGSGAGGVGHSWLRGGTVTGLLSVHVMPPAHSNSIPPLLLCTQTHYMSGTHQCLPACQTSQSQNATCGLYLFSAFTTWAPTQVTELPRPPLSHL